MPAGIDRGSGFMRVGMSGWLNRCFCDSDHGRLKMGASWCFGDSLRENPMLQWQERKESQPGVVTVRDDMRGHYVNLLPDKANAPADAERAVKLFFDALLRPPDLAHDPL
jgi:hypothetical protein